MYRIANTKSSLLTQRANKEWKYSPIKWTSQKVKSSRSKDIVLFGRSKCILRCSDSTYLLCVWLPLLRFLVQRTLLTCHINVCQDFQFFFSLTQPPHSHSLCSSLPGNPKCVYFLVSHLCTGMVQDESSHGLKAVSDDPNLIQHLPFQQPAFPSALL